MVEYDRNMNNPELLKAREEARSFGAERGEEDVRLSIEDQLRKLDALIGELGESTKVLEDRLNPILMSAEAKGEMINGDMIVASPTINPNSMLYKYVQDQQITVRRYVTQVRDMIERVQL